MLPRMSLATSAASTMARVKAGIRYAAKPSDPKMGSANGEPRSWIENTFCSTIPITNVGKPIASVVRTVTRTS